jgi:hypothetical protein
MMRSASLSGLSSLSFSLFLFYLSLCSDLNKNSSSKYTYTDIEDISLNDEALPLNSFDTKTFTSLFYSLLLISK